MPNLDGGHYFLTVLAPVRLDTPTAVHEDAPLRETRSPVQRLAHDLAVLPVGRQTSNSPAKGLRSPFSRNRRNHTARFTIIHQPNFNGRHSGDTLLEIRRNPLAAEAVDRLATPYLLFAADIDAGRDGEAALRAYTDELWATMREELQIIFSACYGFEGVSDAAGFHAYIKRCQVETSLSFNDYWADGMPAPRDLLKGWPMLIAAAGTVGLTALWFLILVVNAVTLLFGVALEMAEDVAAYVAFASAVGLIIVAPLILIVGVWFWWTYSRVLMHGRKPFPVAPNSDLPSILKALYLQQAYARFATEAQRLSPAEMHARFGEFLKATRPDAPEPALKAGECYPEWGL